MLDVIGEIIYTSSPKIIPSANGTDTSSSRSQVVAVATGAFSLWLDISPITSVALGMWVPN